MISRAAKQRPVIRPIPVSPPKLSGDDADLEETLVASSSIAPSEIAPSEPPPSGIRDRDEDTLVFVGARRGVKVGPSAPPAAPFPSARPVAPSASDGRRSPTLENERLSALLAVYENRAELLAQLPDELPPPASASPKAGEDVRRSAQGFAPSLAWFITFIAAARRFGAWLVVTSPRMLRWGRAAVVELNDSLRFGLTQRDRDPLAWIGLCALWGALCSVGTLLLTR